MPRAERAVPVGEAASLFAALGEPRRLSLVLRLSRGGPLSITLLSEDAGVSRQAVTKHLGVLRDAGVVRSEKRGRERIWELEPGRLMTARTFLSKIDQEWDGALERLRALVEDE